MRYRACQGQGNPKGIRAELGRTKGHGNRGNGNAGSGKWFRVDFRRTSQAPT